MAPETAAALYERRSFGGHRPPLQYEETLFIGENEIERHGCRHDQRGQSSQKEYSESWQIAEGDQPLLDPRQHPDQQCQGNAYSAGACTVGVALALLVGMLPWVQEWLISFSDLPRFGVFLLGALAALIVAAPVALYFVLSDK